MNESQNKRRGWIKNILIIFLAVLLILTLFSNTILNHSLPEVAVQYPQYTTISSRIRATASVEANQSYSVTIAQTRVISSVEVRVGQTVSKGDVLFRLEEGDSSELAEANRTLQDLNIQLIQKLKADPSLSTGSSSSGDTVETLKKSLSDARDTLAEAKEELAILEAELITVTAKFENIPGLVELNEAQVIVDQMTLSIETLEEEVARLQGKQGQIGGDGYYTSAEIEELIAEAEAKVSEMNRLFGQALIAYDNAAAQQTQLEASVKAAQSDYDSAKEAYDDYASQMGSSVTYDSILSKAKAVESLQQQISEKEMYFTEAEYTDAYNAYVAAKAAYDAAYKSGVTGADLEALRTAMETASQTLSPLSTKYQEIQSLKTQLASAQQEYWMAMMQYSQYNQQNSTLTGLQNVLTQARNTLEAMTEQLTAATESATKAKTAFTEAQANLDAAEAELAKVEGYREYDSLGDEVKALKLQIAEMEATKADAQKILDSASDANVSAAQAELRAKQSEVNVCQKEVTAAQNKIAELQADIAEAEAKAEAQREQDETNAKLDYKQYQIELAQIREKIQNQQAIVTRLEENQTDGVVVSPVSGIIASLSVSAGQEAAANTAIAMVTLSDMGYTMKCTVTSEQAAKINVGDEATIQWYYYGATPTARVTSIKTDASSQGQNKTITLEVTGDVTPGTSLTFTLGEKNTSYDTVIPNSAVREDSNGKYVLIVSTKSTPLGSRYTARRVDVEVLASDDTNSAVSGKSGSISGEYVITTASTPISAGMQVRLSDNS